MYLILDTETTGLRADARLVQIAWQLHAADRSLIEASNLLIQPAGFTIPEEAAAIHGITTGRALLEGVTVRYALGRLRDAAQHARILVAHNLKFDQRVLDYEYRLLGQFSPFLVMHRIDTMAQTTDFCAIESPMLLRGYKWPKLVELHAKLFSEDFEAHDAGADVAACARCLWALLDQGVIALPQGSQA